MDVEYTTRINDPAATSFIIGGGQGSPPSHPLSPGTVVHKCHIVACNAVGPSLPCAAKAAPADGRDVQHGAVQDPPLVFTGAPGEEAGAAGRGSGGDGSGDGDDGVTLVTHSPPDAPTDVAVPHVTVSQMHVTWKEPANGGVPITDYELAYTVNTRQVWLFRTFAAPPHHLVRSLFTTPIAFLLRLFSSFFLFLFCFCFTSLSFSSPCRLFLPLMTPLLTPRCAHLLFSARCVVLGAVRHPDRVVITRLHHWLG